MAKQDDYTRYTVRFPTPLYERLKEAAGEASVNAEVVARLEASFAAEPSLSAADVQRIIFQGSPTEQDQESVPAPHDLLTAELAKAVEQAVRRRLIELTHEGLAAMFFDASAKTNPGLFYKPPRDAKKRSPQ